MRSDTATERRRVEKNNKIAKRSQQRRWASSFSLMLSWGVFAGKWAACQIGAKSELSGDYSSALLTAGGAEWASITLERRV